MCKLRVKYLLVLTVGIVLAAACKKDESTSESAYFSGSIKIDFPKYVEPGFTKQFRVDTMSTLKREDEQAIGYYFRDSFSTKNDTVCVDGGTDVRVYTLSVKDTIGRFSLVATGFSAGYYSSSSNASFIVVKKGFGEKASLSGFDVKDSDETFTDPRDGRIYYISSVGGRAWMRQNLAWCGAGRGYEDSEAMSDIFGRYYTWEEAQTACPEGWRLPCEDDWVALASSCGVKAEKGTDIPGLAGCVMENIAFNGTRMWPFTREVKITNSSRLSLMPVGMASIEGDEYRYGDLSSGSERLAMLWGSASADGCGECRYLYADRDVVYHGYLPASGFAASVRCIKE